MKPHLLAAHQDHFSLTLAGFLSLCLLVIPSAWITQVSSTDALAGFPMWGSVFVQLCVCVCVHHLLALSRTASQFVTSLPHNSVSPAFSPVVSFPCSYFFFCFCFCYLLNLSYSKPDCEGITTFTILSSFMLNPHKNLNIYPIHCSVVDRKVGMLKPLVMASEISAMWAILPWVGIILISWKPRRVQMTRCESWLVSLFFLLFQSIAELF